MRNILILCTGNICRSPMAEGLFRQYMESRGSKSIISSAGIAALEGRAPVPFAQEVMLEKKNIDISAHRARQITPEMLLNADLILVMEPEQKQLLDCSLPSICGRVHCMGKWGGFDIPDPYLQSKQAFEKTLLLIENSLAGWRAFMES